MIHHDFRVSFGTRVRCALLAALCAIAAFVAAGCTAATPEPEAPAPAGAEAAGADAAGREADPGADPDGAAGYVPADADFARDMIVHHRQALDMAALVPERTGTERFHMLARRIVETQEFEIGLMTDWLEARGEPVPGESEAGEDAAGAGHADHGAHAGMAGMASPEQMAALADAEGAAFERMFLELMIRHHEGALVMVEDLLAHEGAGLEPQLYILISHVDVDQRAEIARMESMLASMERG